MARFIPGANQRVDTHSFQYGLGLYYVEICQPLYFLCYGFKFCLHLHLSLEINLSFSSSAFMDNGVWADRLQLSQTIKCSDLSTISQMRSTAWVMDINYELESIWKEVATMYFRITNPSICLEWIRNETKACQETMPACWCISWFYEPWIRSYNYHMAAVIATTPVNCASNSFNPFLTSGTHRSHL